MTFDDENRRKGVGRLAPTLGAIVVSGILLTLSTAQARKAGLGEMHSSWRYWDDMALATDRLIDWKAGGRERRDSQPVWLDTAMPDFKSVVERPVERFQIRPWEFWRTLPIDRFENRMPPLIASSMEDSGRSLLLAVGFVLLGGVAPYLELWLGVFACLPIMAWCAMELVRSRRAIAMAALLMLIALSPFFAEALSLPHSAVGFYLIALLALLAFSAYAIEGEPSITGLAWRMGPAALVFALCALCRRGVVAFLPAFGLALFWAVGRISAAREGGTSRGRMRQVLVTSALAVVLAVPYLWIRPTRSHNIWVSVWEGLGDFGSERGYSWYDVDVNRHFEEAGITPFKNPKEVNEQHESYCRDYLVAEFRKDPLWFAGIAAKRLWATVSLSHLAPWGPLDGESIQSPRFHYKYTIPIDWFGIGGRNFEVPIQLFFLPVAYLAVRWAMAKRRGNEADRRRIESVARIMAVIAVATLPVAVIISTASAIETQTFALVYFVAAAFALEDLIRAARAMRFRATSNAAVNSDGKAGSPSTK